jgi:hypothetical protein
MKNYYYKRVGISEAIRLLSTFLIKICIGLHYIIHRHYLTYITGNYREHSISSHFRVSSNINTNNTKDNKSLKENNHDKFYEWLAGLIDGDGCFQLSKKGYASLEIVMELRDKHCLY